jgi:hypothetical protein
LGNKKTEGQSEGCSAPTVEGHPTLATLAGGQMAHIEHCSETGDDNASAQGMMMGHNIQLT